MVAGWGGHDGCGVAMMGWGSLVPRPSSLGRLVDLVT